MESARETRLREFVAWADRHITGDEKGEAQVFLDRLLQGFGHAGVKEAGAVLEKRVKDRARKGTAFADLVWKPYVLIEMKKRGEDLARHYRQAFDYWTHLVPNRPRYVILCNFDEFWIYDFETQMDVPVDTVALADLPTRNDPLTFLFPDHQAPTFQNHHEKVTRGAADCLATCFNKLMVHRHVQREAAQRFILQMLVAFFAEDIGLLPHSLVLRLLSDCKKPEDTYDLLGALFEAMNTPGGITGGRFKGVDYFNGGLFAQPARLELQPDEVAQLETAAKYDWSKVRPEIFGTIFEHSLGQEQRRAFGCHFTHPTDIMKIVGPTIVRPWTERIENATTLRQLGALRDRMQRYTVLDPACGAGNFLYLAYRELKRLEARLIERFTELQKGTKGQRQIGFVTARQFYGMDINPFAVEIAKVTMMIARKLAIDELRIDESPLPLDNLDANFIAGDALVEPLTKNGHAVQVTLFSDAENPYASGHVIPTKWPNADVIIGNPPFVGAKLLKPQRGADYVNAVRKTYPAVPGMADYCIYWLRKAHDHLPVCTPGDPVAGRAGLVGTQNIRNNKSRVGGLDYIVQSGTIVEAVDNQPWSGEANVHVSIVNWVKTGDSVSRAGTGQGDGAKHEDGRKSEPRPRGRGQRRRGAFHDAESRDPNHDRDGVASTEAALLIPAQRRLWYCVRPAPDSPLFAPQPHKGEVGDNNGHPRRKDKSYDLAYRECRLINSALSDHVDVSGRRPLHANKQPKRCFQGKIPGYDGFVLDADAVRRYARDSADVIVPYLTGRELLDEFRIERWAIDFQGRDMAQASAFPSAFRHCQKHVLPAVRATYEGVLQRKSDMLAARREHLDRWWQFWNRRDELSTALKRIPRYVACSRVTRRPIMVFLSSRICPSDLIQVFAFEDDYSFGILQSQAHFEWFRTSSRLKVETDLRYSVRDVFETFPWPQGPGQRHVRAVAVAARKVRSIREGALQSNGGGLRALYRLLELPGRHPLKSAHAELDQAVLDAFRFQAKVPLLDQLLALNQTVADAETAGAAVTKPGIPEGFTSVEELFSQDCYG